MITLFSDTQSGSFPRTSWKTEWKKKHMTLGKTKTGGNKDLLWDDDKRIEEAWEILQKENWWDWITDRANCSSITVKEKELS